MLSIETLINIICTEAIEYGGLQEVPDRTDGTTENYHARKRNAREKYHGNEKRLEGDLPPIRFDLELIEDAEGRLRWLE